MFVAGFLIIILAVACAEALPHRVVAFQAKVLSCVEKPFYIYRDAIEYHPQGNYTEIIVWIPSLLHNYKLTSGESNCSTYSQASEQTVYAVNRIWWRDCCFTSVREALYLAQNVNSALLEALVTLFCLAIGIGSILHCFCSHPPT